MLRKARRIKLGKEVYRRLMKRVLERDGWRCQKCGSLENLQVHHQIKRSQQGDDALANLVTLCAHCHMAEHGQLCSSLPAVRGRSIRKMKDATSEAVLTLIGCPPQDNLPVQPVAHCPGIERSRQRLLPAPPSICFEGPSEASPETDSKIHSSEGASMKLELNTLVTSDGKKIITGTWRPDSGQVTSQTVKSIDLKSCKTTVTNVSGGKLLP